MAARTYYYVVVAGQSWAVKYDTQPAGTSYVYMTQQAAIDAATTAAKAFAELGYPSGVKIQGADGKFRDERTYLFDPNPPRG